MSHSKHRSDKLPSQLLLNKQSVTRLQAGHSSIVDLPNILLIASSLAMNKQAFTRKRLGLLE